jgi:hypothetical protein
MPRSDKIRIVQAILPTQQARRRVNQGVRVMTLRETSEPEDTEASDDPLHFIVGQDHTGHWVVTETHGLYGGIFCDKRAALRFAKFETADRKGELEVTSERIELTPQRKARH